MIVNQLANVLIDTIAWLQETDRADEARFTAEQAHDVLLGYDDDVAEHIRHIAQEGAGDMHQTRSADEVTW